MSSHAASGPLRSAWSLARRLSAHRTSPFQRVAGPFQFTEGPVWDGAHILFTDIPSNRIIQHDPATLACRVLRSDTCGANGLTCDRHGRLYACEQTARRVVRYEPKGGVTTIAEQFQGRCLNSPNDVIVDSLGCVWFSDPRYGNRRADMELDHESVFRLEGAGDGSSELVRVTFDTTRPNGLALSPDERTLYVAESPQAPEGRRQLRAYPVRPDRTLGEMTILHDFGPHRGIDGVRVDAEGHVVAACGWRRSGAGPRVAVFTSAGDLLEEYAIPVEPTNVCFGGADLSDLYVTAYDGGLWRAKTGRRGLAW